MKGVTYTEDGTPLWGGKTEQEILNRFQKEQYKPYNWDYLRRADGWCWTGKQFDGQRYGIWTASRTEQNSPITCTYALRLSEDRPVSSVYKLREKTVEAKFPLARLPFVVNFLRDDTLKQQYERGVRAISCLLTHYRSEEKLVPALATALIEYPSEFMVLVYQIAEIQKCSLMETIPIWREAKVWRQRYYHATRGKPEAQQH